MASDEVDPRITLRGLTKLNRKMKSLAADIKVIRDKGVSAMKNTAERTLFSGMHAALEGNYTSFMNAYDEILDYCTDHELTSFPTPDDTELLKLTKQYYYEAKGVHIRIEEAKNPPSPAGGRPSLFNESNIQLMQPQRIILPNISIRPFSGKYSEWTSFKQLFESLIIKDEALTNIQRFHFLISYLEGPAKDAIKAIEVTESNFQQAWEALCAVYNNKRKIAMGYIDRLLSFKPNTNKPSAESLQLYLSNVSEAIVSLKNLNITDFAEYLLCELALRALDVTTRQAFELSIIGTEFPSFSALKEFVQNRCQVLGLTTQEPTPKLEVSDKPKVFKPNKFTPKNNSGSALLAHSETQQEKDPANKVTCYVCKNSHIIKECPKFKSSTPSQRLELLKNFPGCRNCLYPFHTTSQCKSKYSCKHCNKRHHKDLHLGTVPSKPSNDNTQSSSDTSGQTNALVCGATISSSNGVLLGTVRAFLLDSVGRAHEFRGILDPGSQFSFIVESAARELGKSTKPFRGNITGVSSSPLQKISGKINITFQPKASSHLHTEAIVVPSITPPLPQTNLSSDMWYDYQSYSLSDPEFNLSQPVSFLIGADLYPEVISSAPVTLHENGPRLIDTVFGFSVIGRYVCDSQSTQPAESPVACLIYLEPHDFPIEKFWEIEEPLLIPTTSKDDLECEEHFVKTHYRVNGGRYGVRLPFKPGSPKIVPNIKVALNRFYSLETKLAKNEQLKADYHAFMRDYLKLGHMSVAKTHPSYVIPHHPVYKYDRQGKGKLRVVFDASFVTPSGSLNDNLFTEPKLQSDIGSVVLNFRRFEYVVTCDIVKCFRQILVHPQDRRYQQIAWRFDPSEAVTFYELNTVTYGLRSSPYQSQRVILQLLKDEGEAYPLAAQALRESIYVDDCPCGADSPEQLVELKNQLSALLGKGGFELAKWNTNYPPLLEGEPTAMQPIPICDEDEDCTTKILGMAWDPRSDTFKYDINLPEDEDFSKRNILSVIARLFDPLGYVAPIIFHAKTILQETWKSGVNWDDEVPLFIQTVWARFMSDLHNISCVAISRPIAKTDTIYRLIAFSDASENGYCGVLYVHSTQGPHSSMNLIKSKTKLAPLKSMTIPRLELQGALLLSQLIKSVEPLIKTLNIKSYFCFTDSQIVLAWLRTPTYQLKTFVANRTQQILDITSSDWWYHIKGVENPADCGSRGTLPSDLLQHDLWWSGPAWCKEPVEGWPISQEMPPMEVPETKPPKPAVALAAVQQPNDFVTYMQRHSSFTRLVRVMGYVKRFIANVRIPKRRRRRRKTGPLSAIEFRQAHNTCVRLIQQHHFPEVFKSPAKEGLGKELRRLAVFVDHENLIRVGGRLSNAHLSTDWRHPILLPARSQFTDLVIDHLHRKNNHPGPAALVAFLRQQYWVPRARNLIRIHKLKCVVCTRYAKSATAPLMGDLPSARVTGIRAFMNCGVDMAGPFICRDSERRNSKTHKAYLCIFTCLASRALHLELCNALSAESFLDAFDRFTARRGIPAKMQSDNGSNFLGTARYLQETHEFILNEENQSAIINRTSHLNVEWIFNPPLSPHFGGSWESEVKSVKGLLYKTIGSNSYTANELNTVFVKIEGILNSRPLLPLSTDSDDPEVLTPGHFTIGQPTNALPEPDFTDISPNRLNRWQLVRERVQYFWNRWKEEYLSSLQVRARWDKKTPNLQIGDVVLIKNNHTSPTHWPMARVTEIHPGRDDVVRVVTLKASKGIFKRSAVNLVPLPINDHAETLSSG